MQQIKNGGTKTMIFANVQKFLTENRRKGGVWKTFTSSF
jgi:hypothetical protein